MDSSTPSFITAPRDFDSRLFKSFADFRDSILVCAWVLVRILAFLDPSSPSLLAFLFSLGFSLLFFHPQDTLFARWRLVEGVHTGVKNVHRARNLDLDERIEITLLQSWVDKCLTKIISVFVEI